MYMKRIVCFLTLIICFCMTPIQAQKKMMSQEEFAAQLENIMRPARDNATAAPPAAQQ